MRVWRSIDRTKGLSRVDPPLDEGWSPLQRLDWKRSLVLHDNDLRSDSILVDEADVTVDGEPAYPALYAITVGRSTWGPMTFDGTWDFLNGVEAGAMLARAHCR